MNRISAIAIAAAALATPFAAQATVVDVTFSGLVQSEISSGSTVGSVITGEFIYDTTLAVFKMFSIGGESVAAGFASQADLSADRYSALYQAQLSPVAVGGDLNSSFNVDLEGLNGWTASDAGALLSSAELPLNLDKTLSSFGYYMANSNGSNITSLTASLTHLQVSTVPEPASIALLLAGIAVVGAAVRRRSQG
jgi:hypothetical protein